MSKAGCCRFVLLLLLLAATLSGCGLPGLQLNDYGQTSPWYQNSDPRYVAQHEDHQAVPDYHPQVFKITPALVSHMHSNPPADSLSKALIAGNGDIRKYKVGPGDLLGIIVYNHPELTNPAQTTQSFAASGRLVSANGEVYFPFVGLMDVGGLTIGQIRKKLTTGLERVILEPQVDVRVLKFRSKHIYVVGDVGRPCAIAITDIPLTVVKALDECRARTTSSDMDASFGMKTVRLVRNGQTIPVDLNALYRSGHTLSLQPGDRLVVDSNDNRVFMVGEFKQQTAVPISTAGGLSLMQAISEAGGLDLTTADASEIYVIRGFVGSSSTAEGGVVPRFRPRIYHLNASSVDAFILADQFPLQPRDVVFAAPASLVNFNRALALIMPSLNALFQTAVIFDRSN